MTSIVSQDIGQAGGSPKATEAAGSRSGPGTRLRLSLGAVAVLALVALAALDGRSVSQDPGFQAEPAQTFDGRGKWTGYAR